MNLGKRIETSIFYIVIILLIFLEYLEPGALGLISFSDLSTNKSRQVRFPLI